MDISPSLELLVSQLVSRSRLLERVVHDPGPWTAVAYGSRVVQGELTREILPREGRIVLTGYLPGPSAGISAIGIWCGNDMVTCIGFREPCTSPCRFTMQFGINAGELAA